MDYKRSSTFYSLALTAEAVKGEFFFLIENSKKINSEPGRVQMWCLRSQPAREGVLTRGPYFGTQLAAAGGGAA